MSLSCSCAPLPAPWPSSPPTEETSSAPDWPWVCFSRFAGSPDVGADELRLVRFRLRFLPPLLLPTLWLETMDLPAAPLLPTSALLSTPLAPAASVPLLSSPPSLVSRALRRLLFGSSWLPLMPSRLFFFRWVFSRGMPLGCATDTSSSTSPHWSVGTTPTPVSKFSTISLRALSADSAVANFTKAVPLGSFTGVEEGAPSDGLAF